MLSRDLRILNAKTDALDWREQGRTYEEIATRLGVSVKYAKELVSTGSQSVRVLEAVERRKKHREQETEQVYRAGGVEMAGDQDLGTWLGDLA